MRGRRRRRLPRRRAAGAERDERPEGRVAACTEDQLGAGRRRLLEQVAGARDPVDRVERAVEAPSSAIAQVDAAGLGLVQHVGMEHLDDDRAPSQLERPRASACVAQTTRAGARIPELLDEAASPVFVPGGSSRPSDRVRGRPARPGGRRRARCCASRTTAATARAAARESAARQRARERREPPRAARASRSAPEDSRPRGAGEEHGDADRTPSGCEQERCNACEPAPNASSG